jgi:hypothetical protein
MRAINEQASVPELHGCRVMESRLSQSDKAGILSLVVNGQYKQYSICQFQYSGTMLQLVQAAVVKDPLFDLLHTISSYNRKTAITELYTELDRKFDDWLRKTFITVKHRINRYNTLNILARPDAIPSQAPTDEKVHVTQPKIEIKPVRDPIPQVHTEIEADTGTRRQSQTTKPDLSEVMKFVDDVTLTETSVYRSSRYGTLNI